MYGENLRSGPNVAFWCAKFSAGCSEVLDEDRSGRPRTSITDENIAAADELIQGDRHVHVQEIALQLDISYRSVHGIIHDSLGY